MEGPLQHLLLQSSQQGEGICTDPWLCLEVTHLPPPNTWIFVNTLNGYHRYFCFEGLSDEKKIEMLFESIYRFS